MSSCANKPVISIRKENFGLADENDAPIFCASSLRSHLSRAPSSAQSVTLIQHDQIRPQAQRTSLPCSPFSQMIDLYFNSDPAVLRWRQRLDQRDEYVIRSVLGDVT